MATIGRILAVPGLASTTPAFRAALLDVARRNGWDVDAMATVMSLESGFNPAAKNPNATASGLIQMIDSTARSLGVPGGAEGVRKLSAVEQLPYVELFYQRAFGRTLTPRLVDFYLAGWGSGVGQQSSHVLARETDEKKFNGGKHNLYTLNRSLDRNGDGTITVGDLDALMRSAQAKAGGRYIDVDEGDASAPDPLGSTEPAPELARPGFSSPALVGDSLRKLCADLPVLERGAVNDVVPMLAYLLGQQWEGRAYVTDLVHQVRVFQSRRRLKVDGQVGPKTWAALLAEVRPWQ